MIFLYFIIIFASIGIIILIYFIFFNMFMLIINIRF